MGIQVNLAMSVCFDKSVRTHLDSKQLCYDEASPPWSPSGNLTAPPRPPHFNVDWQNIYHPQTTPVCKPRLANIGYGGGGGNMCVVSILWANGIVAHYPDKVAYDDLAGTMVWKSIPVTCQRSMATLYQGPAQLMKHRDNRNSFIEENDLIFVEQPAQGRYAAFSIDQRDELCSRSILRTQMSAVIIHELTPSTPPILVDDVHVDSLMEIQASSNQAFHHFKGHLKGHEVTTFTHSTICQGERQMMFGFLSMAAAENKYSLYGKFGEGYSITRAGAVVHIGQCPPVSAQIRQSPNCTQEVPVVVEGQEAWVDPITRNLVDFPTPVPCDPLNPVTFRLDGRWMCATPDFHPCPDPLQLSPNSRDNTGIELYYKFARGTGRGIVTQSTLQKHLDFVHEAMARGPASRMVNNLYKVRRKRL